MMGRLYGLETVSPAELGRSLANGSVTLFDVNSPASWRAARIPGARHLEGQTFTAADIGMDPQRALVFYCSGPLCRKAPQAARRALRLGFANVRVLGAGISGWQAAGLPTEAGT